MTVTMAMTAMLTSVVLSELAFDSDDIAYWRRWLGRFGYLWRRVLLALVPAALAVLLCQAISSGGGVFQQLGKGLTAGVAAAALLRADTRTHMRTHASAESAQAASALTWIYRQACRRFDAVAGRRVISFTQTLRMSGNGSPTSLLLTAEEIEGVLSQELNAGQTAKRRKICQDHLASLREQMDLVLDPLAGDRDRRRAATALSESIANEMTQRKWNRPPVRTEP